KPLSLALYPVVAREAAAFRPDVVVERYYNLAGAGLLYARRHGLGGVLEVNAPLYDPPGSRKDRLDRALGRPLRRWAGWQARAADRIVTPLATTVGKFAPGGKIVELPWGANTDLFDPARVGPGERAAVRRRLGIPPGARVVAFSGSFRAWHGVGALLGALRELLPRAPDLWALLLGDGPERPGLERAARDIGEAGRRVVFAGRQPYEEVPGYLAAADVGAAPFEPARHPALRHFGFYWSPLKVFEYGAMALPVVCPDLPPLSGIVRDGREGRLYREGDPAALAAALAELLGDAAARRALGAAARERVVRHYSWAAHCRALDETLRCVAH
ncbi:MAG TPA: glycosyltransferase, partial [Thermomicrobiales bacterium]|nr:glycosyltransferase [Thermomicrobiales bacterium]